MRVIGRRVLTMVSTAAGLAVGACLVMQPTSASAANLPVSYYPTNAGYAVYSTSTPPTTAIAQLRVPALTCSTENTGVGFGVVVENADGSSRGSPTVGEACNKGQAVYTANININNVNTVLSATVKPNDLLTLSASQTSTATSVTFTDNSTGFTKTLTGTGSTSAFGFVGSVPDEARPSLTKVATFSTFSFTHVGVNGAAIGTYTAATGLYEAIQTTGGKTPPAGTVEIQPGPLGTSSFSLTWVST